MNRNSGYQPKPTGKPIPPPPNRGSSVQRPANRELWTDINNSGDGKQKYTIRFRTNSERDYRIVEEVCRGLIDNGKS